MPHFRNTVPIRTVCKVTHRGPHLSMSPCKVDLDPPDENSQALRNENRVSERPHYPCRALAGRTKAVSKLGLHKASSMH